MSSDARPLRRRGSAREHIEDFFEQLRLKPLTLVVFLLSAAVLILMTQHRQSLIHAPGVGSATPVHHSADLVSEGTPFVAEVHVQPGDAVEAGDPLVTLSARYLKQELALIEAEVAVIEAEAQVDVKRIVVEEQNRALNLHNEVALARRDLALARAEASRQARLASDAESQLDTVNGRVKAGVSSIDTLREAQLAAEDELSEAEKAAAAARAEGLRHNDLQEAAKSLEGQSTLFEPMKRAKEAEVRLLVVRRRGILADLENLVVRALAAGKVQTVLPLGSAVKRELSIVTLVPLEATEIVAYVPPEKSVVGLAEGASVSVTGVCSGDAEVLRVGIAVVEAPLQLGTLLGRAFTSPVIYGTPVRVSIPSGCSFGVGQALVVELPESSR